MSERKCAPLTEIPKALEKTGFLLEHEVAEEFRRAGWAVIAGRYYVDDVDEKTRELDLIVYKVRRAEDVDVITGVLISCKKDESNTWAFMTRDKASADPNFDWEPVHCWTDCEPLAAYLATSDWRKSYVHGDSTLYAKAFEAKRTVFAFQQVSASGTAPKNDKSIFDSVTGLLKALDHELMVLPNRAKGRKRLYFFSLATIVDAPLVDVHYVGSNGTATEIEGLVHVARYLVRKREVSALIHFVRSDKTKKFVEVMGELSNYNSDHALALIREAHDAIRTNGKVRAYFAKELEKKLKWKLNRQLVKHGKSDSISSFSLAFRDNRLSVELDIDEEHTRVLNEDVDVRSQVQDALRTIARYVGEFELTWDTPF